MSIRVRLGLLLAAVTLLLLVAGGGVFVAQLHRHLLNAVDGSLRARADPLVQAIPAEDDGLDFQDAGGEGLIAPTQALAQVVDGEGRVQESSEAAGGQPLLTESQRVGAQRGAELFTVRLAATGERIRLLAVPVSRVDGTWVVVVGSTLDPTDNAIARVRSGLLIAAAPVVLGAGLAGSALAGAALRPVERMRIQAASFSSRDAHARLDVPNTTDEIASLGRTMNALLDRLHGALARERGFVADAGHELRTPLGILRTELELARRPGRTKAELASAIASAGQETDRLCRLAEDMLLLASSDDGQLPLRMELSPVVAIVAEVVDASARLGSSRGVMVSLTGATEVTAVVDADRLRQALDNLLDNAVRFSPNDSTVNVAVSATASTVRVAVHDAGPGFAPDFIPHAFERFRRSDAARGREQGGTGLGLAIVQSIALAHGGHVSAGNAPGGGALVTLEVPLGSRHENAHIIATRPPHGRWSMLTEHERLTEHEGRTQAKPIGGRS